MRKILIDYGLFGRVARRRHFLSNKYLVVCCMWTKHQTSAQIPHKICQHGGGGVMIWLCSATTGPGHPAFMNLTMNNSVHLSILESNMRLSVGQLKLGWNWVMQQHSDPNHGSKSSCNDPVTVQTSILLKCCGGTFKELCMNEWANIPPQRCERFCHFFKCTNFMTVGSDLWVWFWGD